MFIRLETRDYTDYTEYSTNYNKYADYTSILARLLVFVRLIYCALALRG